MKAKATALIFVVMFVLPGASAELHMHGAESSITNVFLNKSLEPGPLPDLIIKSATFHYSKAVIVVQNVGLAPSGKADVALLLLSGTDPSSKVTNRFDKPVATLSPGQIFNIYFDIGNLTVVKHARRIMVDATKVVAESNENNNITFNNDFVAEQGAFPEPADSNLSNLIFSMVKFIAHDMVHYCVKNTGYVSGDFTVKTTIFKGATKDSGATYSHSEEHDSLGPNGTQCRDFSTLIYLEGRGRQIEIILKTWKDADSTNKTYFSPGTQDLWQPKQ